MKEITIEKSLFDQLMAVSVWYAAIPTTPDFYIGDRFHENVSDFQHSCIPDGVVAENMFISHFELTNGELIAAFGYHQFDGATEDQFVLYKIVSK